MKAEDFTGKIALVTGGGSGIGRATALRFADGGTRVVVSDISAEAGEQTVELIKEAGGDALFVRANMAEANEVEAMIRRTVDAYGRLDFAHNNAGIEGVKAPIVECSEENWDRVISVNLKGVWLCMKYEIAQMLKNGGGAIVNTSSVAGLTAVRNLPAYVASKHGVSGLTRAAAVEYAASGIRVNAVCPGIIRTPLIERITGGDPKEEAKRVAFALVGRMGRPEEVAEAVIWLCSERSSFIVGQTIVMDGGWTLHIV